MSKDIPSIVKQLIEKFSGEKLPENFREMTLRNDLNISSLDLIIMTAELEEIIGKEINLQDLISDYLSSENPVIEDLTIGNILEYLEA